MSALTEALDRILNWLQKHSPSDVSSLQPGLSEAEIEEIVKDLPVRLPQEVCELYRWRNGSRIGGNYWEFSQVFGIWSFMPLQFAIIQYHQWNKFDCKPWPVDSNSFYSSNIFFNFEPIESGYVVIDETQKAGSVVFQYCKAGHCNLIGEYDSITAMMLTIAERYENAYYVNAEGHLIRDTNIASQIWHKYNSSHIEEATLAKREKELSMEPIGALEQVTDGYSPDSILGVTLSEEKVIYSPVDQIKDDKFTELIKQTNSEIKRIVWNLETCRKALGEIAGGKRSRILCTNEELEKFLDYLKSQPTPEIPDKR